MDYRKISNRFISLIGCIGVEYTSINSDSRIFFENNRVYHMFLLDFVFLRSKKKSQYLKINVNH